MTCLWPQSVDTPTAFPLCEFGFRSVGGAAASSSSLDVEEGDFENSQVPVGAAAGPAAGLAAGGATGLFEGEDMLESVSPNLESYLSGVAHGTQHQVEENKQLKERIEELSGQLERREDYSKQLEEHLMEMDAHGQEAHGQGAHEEEGHEDEGHGDEGHDEAFAVAHWAITGIKPGIDHGHVAMSDLHTVLNLGWDIDMLMAYVPVKVRRHAVCVLAPVCCWLCTPQFKRKIGSLMLIAQCCSLLLLAALCSSLLLAALETMHLGALAPWRYKQDENRSSDGYWRCR